MWILTNKLRTSHFVADTKASELDLEQFSQLCETSLTWRGKDSQSRTWLQRWKRVRWIKLLSLRTLKPSHTESFVDAWTSSLADSRVSHSQLLESVKLLKTQDTFSPTSQTESKSANLELFFSKTCKESLVARQPTENQFSSMSSESWKDWVIKQRLEYSQRKKLARHTRESVFTSLAWPTASVAGCVEGGIAKNVEMTQSGFKATRENGTSYGAKLRDSVIHHEKNWATPRAGATDSTRPNGKGGIPLAHQVKNWSTPTVMDTANIQQPRKKNPSGGQKPPLCQEVNQLQNWPTIQARDWKATAGTNLKRLNPNGKPRGTNGELPLAVYQEEFGRLDQAKDNTNGKNQESQTWATPRANQVHPKITEENRAHLATRGKSNLEEEIAGHCGKATGKLNPDWVEQLMGLPTGWTQLPTEWID